MKGYVAVNNGFESLINLVNNFDAKSTVAFRMALVQKDYQWNIHTLVIENIPTGQSNQLLNFNYNYGDTVFIAGTTSGRKVMDFLQGSQVYSWTEPLRRLHSQSQHLIPCT